MDQTAVSWHIYISFRVRGGQSRGQTAVSFIASLFSYVRAGCSYWRTVLASKLYAMARERWETNPV